MTPGRGASKGYIIVYYMSFSPQGWHPQNYRQTSNAERSRDAQADRPFLNVQGILISPRMVEDHSCLTLQEALRGARQLPKLGMSPLESVDYIPPPVPQNAAVSKDAQQGQPDTSTGSDMV